MSTPFRIYLAGPEVFFPEPLKLAQERKQFLATLGLEGIFPLDNEVAGDSPEEIARAIFAANCDLLDRADAVLANMTPFRGPSTDVGTAWEIGYAHALKKPIVAYSDDLSPYHEKVHRHGWSHEPHHTHDRHGHEVENFGGADNLMLTQCILSIHPTFEEAAAFLAKALRES